MPFNEHCFLLISGRILLMKNIHILYMKNTARPMMLSTASLLQWKAMALTSLKVFNFIFFLFPTFGCDFDV